MGNTQKHRMVLVEWLDSKRAADGWEHLDDPTAVEPARCSTVGFLLEEHKDYVIVAPTISRTQVLGRVVIPTCSILKKRRIGFA